MTPNTVIASYIESSPNVYSRITSIWFVLKLESNETCHIFPEPRTVSEINILKQCKLDKLMTWSHKCMGINRNLASEIQVS